MPELSQKERVMEITEKLEKGIKDLFESDKYKAYLNCMSKFHNYSLNNTMLIAAQMPEATLVAGYNSWTKDHERYIKKGEKGIQIIAPYKFNVTEQIETESGPKEQEKEIKGFKVSYNFETRKKRIKKHKGIKGLYIRYCYELGTLPKYRQNYVLVKDVYRDDLLKLHNISAESKLLVENNISSDADLAALKESLQSEIDSLIEQRNTCRKEVRRKGNSQEQIVFYECKRETLTKAIKQIRRNMCLCESIEKRSKEIGKKLEKKEREIKGR